jgi:hypothetical protein
MQTKFMAGKPLVKCPLNNIQKEMGGNINMVLRETGYEDWEWMEYVQWMGSL